MPEFLHSSTWLADSTTVCIVQSTALDRSAHVLQWPQVDACDAQHAEVYTPFTYVESRGEQQMWLAGQWCHRLRREQGAWRIALKRVNLLNAGAAHPAIQLFP